jgi:hypothetical protein
LRASAANDDAVFGQRLASSAIVNAPQFVLTWAVHVRSVASRCFGALSEPSPFGAGAVTFVHPLAGAGAGAAGAAVVAGREPLLLPSLPPHAASSRTEQSRTGIVVWRAMGARDGTVRGMADLERRPGRLPNRRQREQRAFQLVVAGGIAGVVGVVGLVLAIFGVVGPGIPILALIVAAVCVWLFRRTVGP